LKWLSSPLLSSLKSLDFRIRDGKDVILWVRFDEASNTFALSRDASGKFGKSGAPGSRERLETDDATLFLDDTSVVGTGPTGPGVTLNLSLAIKKQKAGPTFVVEVAAADDLGNRDEFVQVGTLALDDGKKHRDSH